MSDSGPIDLADLQLKPRWVDELDKPNNFEAFERGDSTAEREEGKLRRGDGPRDRRERRSGPGGADRSRRPRKGGGGEDRSRRPQGDRRKTRQDRPQGEGRDRRRSEAQHGRPDRPPLYELLDIELLPDEAGVGAVAKQIKMTGRSYPVFDLARLVLAGPERYHARFTLKPETTQVQLIECRLDQSVWLSMAEALRHFRNSAFFHEYYQREEVEVDPPKGNYSVVAVCGLSGEVLGPPNFHTYQTDLADLHQRRFSRMHLDAYKRKIEMVRNEETIEKWKSSLAKEIRYTYLKAAEGEEAPVFRSVPEAEKHFIETHGHEVFSSVAKTTLPGNIPQKRLSGPLHKMLKRAVDRQSRFPVPMVKNVSPMLEKAGLRFFKLGRKETYVARSRPRALGAKTEVSPRIRSVVQFIRDNEKQDLNKLVTALVPNAARRKAGEPTAEEIGFLKDLRWLIREGFVIEFSNGELRLGSRKSPLPPASKSSKAARSREKKSPPPSPAPAEPSGRAERCAKIKEKRRAARRQRLRAERHLLRRGKARVMKPSLHGRVPGNADLGRLQRLK